ncbi:MAG TPA: hypothetical protein DCM64_09650 [Gammaproteobacteria bacterium]|jgi:iron complex outermembrane receptor protein|nr:TonB-dependent receptor [Gammaproteobacteria bacterium]MDP6733149.1 TonB-dependent receptor [Gammaproteobacteria bacterium]HAJ76705.1 hypothetical protein [Gammaproteobacteria bacterium]|tara:strand:- start:529 stop:2673 length:2145 start_codon:yes stop_codon:yes gene_type:complete
MKIINTFAVSAGYASYILLSAQGVSAAENDAQVNTSELEHSDAAIEEIIVTSSFHRSRAETALPVNILTGEELREKVGTTLGDTLQNEVGVNIASFGVNVGAPVIRGQTANRVQVLQGGVGNIDASAISADHTNSLEPALADRIEVLRGPSTLLYGNGAIGGVVNVIDNRIPTQLPNVISGLFETRNNSASDQQVSVLKMEGAIGQFAWHADGIYRDSNDVEIPKYAINPEVVDFTDEDATSEFLETRGRIANSDARATVKTLGASRILDEGYLGFSFNRLENDYGIPPVPSVHHEDEDHDEELEEAHEHVHEDVRIVMEQDRFDFELAVPLAGWFQEVHGRVSVVDYEHAEIEASGEVGTVFEQDGLEGRFSFHLNMPENHDSIVGLHFSRRKFEATGEEAFIPETDIDSTALFSIYSIDTDSTLYELGIRAEHRELEQNQGSCRKSSTSYSGSGSAIWRITERTNLLFSLSHSQRSGTVEELYSNISTSCTELPTDLLVQHAATQRFEIGNPDAGKEKSTNIEVGARKHMGFVTGEISYFYNDISDYLYLFDTDRFQDDVEISRYLTDDAVFHGFEVELNIPLYQTGDHLADLTFFSDYVDAEFDSHGNVPRIPGFRYGVEWRHSHLDWQIKMRWSEVEEQSDLGANESSSKGYSLLNFHADYHLQSDSLSGLLFVRGINLLDEAVRHHSSLLKDYAPAPGRALEIGMRMEF